MIAEKALVCTTEIDNCCLFRFSTPADLATKINARLKIRRPKLPNVKRS